MSRRIVCIEREMTLAKGNPYLHRAIVNDHNFVKFRAERKGNLETVRGNCFWKEKEYRSKEKLSTNPKIEPSYQYQPRGKSNLDRPETKLACLKRNLMCSNRASDSFLSIALTTTLLLSLKVLVEKVER